MGEVENLWGSYPENKLAMAGALPPDPLTFDLGKTKMVNFDPIFTNLFVFYSESIG